MRSVSALIVTVLLSSLAACTAGSCGDTDPSNGPTLVVVRARDSTTLDPAKATDMDAADVITQIFETLVAYSPASFDVEPALATSWHKSTDLKTWTFQLRKNVYFHDGTPFDADAVVHSFRRQAKGGVRQAEFSYWNSSFSEIIDKVERVGPYVVRFRLTQPYAPFLASLAMFPVSIVSPKATKKLGDRFARQPVGTGPYQFVSWDRRGGRITLERFDRYWGEKPGPSEVIFRKIADARQRIQALQSGAAHIIRNVDPGLLQLVRLHPDLRVSMARGNTVAYLALNTSKPPFNNPYVRWAVNRAVRKHVLVKLIFQGLAEPAKGPLPPVLGWAYNSKVRAYPYDPKRARQQLEASGYDDDPAGRPALYVMETPRPYLPRPIMAARMVARDLEKVGMPVRVVAQPFDKHKQSITRGEHHLALYGWVGDNGDPDNFLSTLLAPRSPLNVSFWRHAGYAKLIKAARETRRETERARYYKEAQALVAKQAPWVPLAHTKMVVALRREVRNFELGPASILYIKRVGLR
jgi:peptide/nickel transport system substrate-binding protein